LDLLHGITPEPIPFESVMQLVDFLSYDEKTNPDSKNFSKFESQISSNCFAALSSQKSIAPENLPKIGLILASLKTKGLYFRSPLPVRTFGLKTISRNNTVFGQYDSLSWCRYIQS